jgi:hypothetical protein
MNGLWAVLVLADDDRIKILASVHIPESRLEVDTTRDSTSTRFDYECSSSKT